MRKTFWNTQRDAFIAAVLFFASFALYARTLAPSVAFIFDDSLEMQYVIPRLGIVHPTGYPLYALLGKIFTLVVPLNDPAFRLNLFSALCAALAVAMLYLTLRPITNYPLPSIVGALLLAVSQAFWEQAVVAEVYALQMLLAAIILYAALHYGKEPSTRGFYWLAFSMGLGLTHHRLVVLLYPAIATYVLLVNRNLLRDFKTLATAAIIFMAPLLLYLYLPLRGAIGSADGTYENTLAGFLTWASGAQYTIFLTQDPLQVQHDSAFFWMLFQNQFGILGLTLAGLGIVWLAHKPREWILLVAALTAEAVFAFNYHTADVEVHFLTTFLLLAILAGAGADALFAFKIQNSKFELVTVVYRVLLFILILTIPVQAGLASLPRNDLSMKWDVHDYAMDLLDQPTENRATLIGILGEMTLVRYFQNNAGLRPDLETIPADKEPERLAAIERALKQNRVVYLTRSLKGAAEKYSLDSLGPLIRVRTKSEIDTPKISNPLNEDFGWARLIGYAVDDSRLSGTARWHAENGRVVRVTVYWKADEKTLSDATVSLKIFSKDRHVAGQSDHRPVLDAYPTNTWRAGEIIADTYDVPIFLGAPPGDYTVSVTMYDARSGAVFGSRDLRTIALAPDFVVPRPDAWNIAHPSDADFGAFTLAGFTLDADAPARPGDALPLTLLWRATQTKISDSLKVRVWLEDEAGKSVASRDAAIGLGYPVSEWRAGQFVRAAPLIRVPANVADGKYRVKLAVARGDQLLGGVPGRPSIVDLGTIEIKNRARVVTAPASLSRPLEVTFNTKIRLLGYDFTVDASRNAQLTLYWKALALMDTSYTVFVHLLDAKDNVVVSGDAAPGNSEFPTTGWVENEFITDVHSFAIPDGIAPGSYRVEIGWYDPTTGTRLKTVDGQDRVILSPIDIP